MNVINTFDEGAHRYYCLEWKVLINNQGLIVTR